MNQSREKLIRISTDDRQPFAFAQRPPDFSIWSESAVTQHVVRNTTPHILQDFAEHGAF